MKKNIFLILVTTLFILILLYFYDEKEYIQNEHYIKDNTYIEYPYFNNLEIDTYINNYLKNKITNNNNVFIDYDYEINNHIVSLNIYTYKEYNNKINYSNKLIEIDYTTSKIINNSNIIEKKTSNEYTPYNSKRTKNNKIIALTFDDGPNHNTSKIIDLLNKYNVKATFFLVGKNITDKEEIIKKMYNSNMEIGNHTYSHKLLTRLDSNKVLDEINKTDNIIYSNINTYPTLIRPSYGSSNKKIRKLLDRPIIYWNIDTLDWKYHNSKSISNRVLNKVQDGDIILMHDIYTATYNSLKILIPELINNGYTITTVTDLFNKKKIPLNKGKIYRYAR